MGDVKAGGAFVQLSFRGEDFEKGFRRLSRSMQAFAGKFRTIGLGLSAAGGAIIAPIAAATKHFADFGDSLQKTSLRTGFSAESLSQLGFAAERSGTNLRSLGQALFRMQRRVANATTETGPAVRALKELGLSAEELTRLSPEQRFEVLADALKGVQDETRAAQLGFEIFGDNFRDIKPLLDEGSQGIRALRQEADDLGLTMSQDTANKAAALSDAMGKLFDVLKDVGIEIGSAMAPLITDLAERLAKIATRVATFIENNQGLVRVMATVGGALVVAGGLFLGFATAISVVASALTALGTVLAVLSGPIGIAALAIGAIAGGVGFLAARRAIAGAGGSRSSGAGGATAAAAAEDKLKKLSDSASGASDELKKLREWAARMSGVGGPAIEGQERRKLKADEKIADMLDAEPSLTDGTFSGRAAAQLGGFAFPRIETATERTAKAVEAIELLLSGGIVPVGL